VLEFIKEPKDLRGLSTRELKALAAEIRERIIRTVSHNGGHLGANLGTVELTLALHSVWNSPEDKIIWDVGHQCYAHKLITGRGDRFDTLRQFQGLSGFPKRSESVHDAFDVGHSSTSISAAAGMAAARDLQGKSFHIAAVIGDGALTGGMALEALNHVGQLQTNLVVVLNDNEMSIAKNVGAIADYLSRMRLDPTLSRAREELESMVSRIPGIGSSVNRAATGVKDALKKTILPGQLFMELGFSYFGPFDGHNIPQMQAALQDASKRGGPILLHTMTQKGRGYAPAEKEPSKFHGVGPWVDVKTSRSKRSMSFSDVFGGAVLEAAQHDPRVVAVTAAMKDGTGLQPFAECFPDRLFDVGIAEQHSLTFAAGLAAQGQRPVVALYSTFLQRGYDQVLHDICLGQLPVIIGVDRAGVVGDDGPTHHGVFDISFLRPIPGLTLLAPGSAEDLEAMVHWALQQTTPVAIRYPRGRAARWSPQPQGSIDKSQWLRQGSDCTVFAVGPLVNEAVKAADHLEAVGVNCGVVNVRSIRPLDRETLFSAARSTGTILTVEDHMIAGGYGSAVLEALASEPDVQVRNLGYPSKFLPQGTIEELHAMHGLNARGIAEAVCAMLNVEAVETE